MDLPTSWMIATNAGDEFTARTFEAINSMPLDMLAAVARRDYDDRRRQQAQGQAKAEIVTPRLRTSSIHRSIYAVARVAEPIGDGP